MTAKRLVLLRHGRTASNAEGRFQGHLDVPLDDVGLAQAEAAGRALAAELAEKVAAGAVRVVASDLSRARRTAEIVAGHLGLPVTVDPALRERDGGSWQGLTREEIKARHGEEFARWMAGEDLVIGGGESLGQAWRRCEAGMSRLAAEQDGGVLVVVGHGASLRGGMLRLLGLVGEVAGVEGPAALAVYRAFDGFENAHRAELVRRKGGPDGVGRWVLRRFNVAPGPVAAELGAPAGVESPSGPIRFGARSAPR